MRLYSIVTGQGTAMPEATLCEVHHADPELRQRTEAVAFGADDWSGDEAWHDSTGNDEVACVECGVTNDNYAQGRHVMDTRTREAKLAALASLETQFEAAGGRGVELAERIDALRAELGITTAQDQWVSQRSTILTVTDAVHLATAIRWAQTNAKVRWLNESGDIQEGTARSLGDERGNFLTADDDVRDGFFRITTTMGGEVFLPVVDVIRMVRNTTMVED